jgi:hypothetical protein
MCLHATRKRYTPAIEMIPAANNAGSQMSRFIFLNFIDRHSRQAHTCPLNRSEPISTRYATPIIRPVCHYPRVTYDHTKLKSSIFPACDTLATGYKFRHCPLCTPSRHPAKRKNSTLKLIVSGRIAPGGPSERAKENSHTRIKVFRDVFGTCNPHG